MSFVMRTIKTIRSGNTGLVVPAAVSTGFSVIASLAAALGPNAGTSSALDTTGANLIVLVVSWYGGTTPSVTVSDSKGNTYTGLTMRSSTNAVSRTRIFYCYAPSVGSGHTFTVAGSSTYATIGVLAVSGAAASPFDVENGAGASSAVNTLAAGSITPTQNNELIVASPCTENSTGKTVDSGMTYTDVAYGAGSNLGGGLGYKIQTTAAAINPTFSWTTLCDAAAAVASFKAA